MWTNASRSSVGHDAGLIGGPHKPVRGSARGAAAKPSASARSVQSGPGRKHDVDAVVGAALGDMPLGAHTYQHARCQPAADPPSTLTRTGRLAVDEHRIGVIRVIEHHAALRARIDA